MTEKEGQVRSRATEHCIKEQEGVGHPLGSVMGKQGEETENLGLETKDQVNWK